VGAASGIIVLLTLALFPAIACAQPTTADVYVEQAVLDFDDKRYEQALDNLRRALQIEPEHRVVLGHEVDEHARELSHYWQAGH